VNGDPKTFYPVPQLTGALQMATKNLYKSRISSVKYAFLNGKEANFINFEYITDLSNEIAELDNEVLQQHPTIYTDPTRLTVDTNKRDPLEDIRAKAVADYIASQKVAMDPKQDRGTSVQGKLNVATSTSISEGAAGSSSGGAGAVPAGTIKAGK